MTTPLATPAQIKLASQNKGRLTKTGRYQSPNEVARRAVQEQRRQLKRNVQRIQNEFNSLQQSGTLSKSDKKIIKDEISHYQQQLDAITVSLPKPKSTKGLTKSQRTAQRNSYGKMLTKAASNAKAVNDFVKTQTARSLSKRKSRYEGHSKAIWCVIYTYTYGDTQTGEGLWDSKTPYKEREKKVREYVRNKLNEERKSQGLEPYKPNYYPSNATVFNFFQQRFREQYNDDSFDIVDYIVSPDNDDKYLVSKGDIALYVSKGQI